MFLRLKWGHNLEQDQTILDLAQTRLVNKLGLVRTLIDDNLDLDLILYVPVADLAINQLLIPINRLKPQVMLINTEVKATTRIDPPKAAPVTVDLLNFGNDLADAPPVKPADDDFADFMAAPGAVKPPAAFTTTGFANFSNPPAKTSGFANFDAFQAPKPQPSNGYANFQQTSPISPQATQFGGFQSMSPTNGNAASNTSFSDFQGMSANDPLSKLVNLDGFSLGSNVKKEKVGESLNALGAKSRMQ